MQAGTLSRRRAGLVLETARFSPHLSLVPPTSRQDARSEGGKGTRRAAYTLTSCRRPCHRVRDLLGRKLNEREEGEADQVSEVAATKERRGGGRTASTADEVTAGELFYEGSGVATVWTGETDVEVLSEGFLFLWSVGVAFELECLRHG